MTELKRRGFLKLGAVTVGGLAVTKYAEPFITTPESKDWITDKGDYVIVRVPDYKTFAREVIDKPAIFILGTRSFVSGVDVTGFVNVAFSPGSVFEQSRINCEKVIAQGARHPMVITGRDGFLQYNTFVCGPVTPSSKSYSLEAVYD